MGVDWLGSSILRLLYALLLLAASLPVRADIADTIVRVRPSVVMVGVYDRLGSPQFSSRGTGFAVGDGHQIATNAHVIEGLTATDSTALVVYVDGPQPEQRIRQARVSAVDPAHDIALLAISGPALPALALADSGMVRAGLSVGFMGFPLGNFLGFTPVTHRAMVSAVTPIVLPTANARQLNATVIRSLKSGSFDIFQLDGTAYPGNSGGPLFDVDTGEVIGIVNMVLVKRTKEAAISSPSGISYAIPVNHLRELLSGKR